MSVSTELGEIDQAGTNRTLDRLQGSFQSCFQKGLGRVDYLGGDFQLFVRVGRDGKTRYAFLEESTLGDRETERCVIDAASRASWPTPEGGEAEVRKRMGFDPPDDVRAPASWGADKVAPALASAGDAIQQCKAAAPGAKFTATAYVTPDGEDGRVQAVGIAVSSHEGDGKAQCLADALKNAKMPSPGSYAAKVTFPL